MATDPARVQAAIAALEAQRGTLGDETTDLALAPLRQLLAQAEGGAGTAALRRAQVTVLFADIVDSTALAGRLDAEDVLQVFGRMLERAAACVQARGGRVLRYTGDGLKAGFGTQGTREDDAAQAVRAGLDLLAAAREHAGWVARVHRVEGFAVRVGVHTGEVALGAGFEADNTLSGETVNIAARMEQSAPPGGLRISAATHAQVRGLFDLQAQPPLPLKGLDAPQHTWLVQRARPSALRRIARGVEGVHTRMIGRDEELQALQSAWTQVVRHGRLVAVTVVGEAGLGKSRLLDEFEAWREAQAHPGLLLRGMTTPQTERQLYGLLRDVLARYLQIADDDSLAVARAKLEQAIVPLFADDEGPDLAEGNAHLLGHLIGIEWRDSRHIRHILADPRQLRDRALHVALQCLRRIAERAGSPLVLLVEDLHWADAESLDFLARWADTHRDAPFMLLVSTRPALFEPLPGWPGDDGVHRRIALAPLGAGHSGALAAELLRRLPSPAPTLDDLLTRQSEGNPYYMEELVRMLVDRGALQVGERWRFDAQRLDLDTVPTTLTGVLQARLDGLPGPERRALQQASIIGPVFWDQALAALDSAAPAQLPALVRRQLALPRDDAALDGLREFSFHHQLLQRVTYGTVLKQDRREGHEKIAWWLAGLQNLRAGDVVGTAAEHFERAGDRPNAIEFHVRAAEQAVQRFAHARVQAHAARALALLDEGGLAPGPDAARLRWRIMAARESSLELQGTRDEQSADLATLVQLAEELDDDQRRAVAAWRRSRLGTRTADWALAESAARIGMACAARSGDDDLRLACLQLVAYARIPQGDIAGGEALALQGLAEARRLGLRLVEARLLNVLSIAAEQQGDLAGSLARDREGLPLFRASGDRINEAIGQSNLGARLLSLGQLADARRELDAALLLLRSNGDVLAKGAATCNLSTLELWQGRSQQACTLGRTAHALLVTARSRDWEAFALLRVGFAELALGHAAAARDAFAQAWEIAHAIDAPEQYEARAGLAQVLLALGDATGAVQALQPVLERVAAGGTLDSSGMPRLIELICHRALAEAGDAPAAADWLARAHGALMAQAAGLHDARLRQGFLDDIPHHRQIVQAWARVAAPVRGALSGR